MCKNFTGLKENLQLTYHLSMGLNVLYWLTSNVKIQNNWDFANKFECCSKKVKKFRATLLIAKIWYSFLYVVDLLDICFGGIMSGLLSFITISLSLMFGVDQMLPWFVLRGIKALPTENITFATKNTNGSGQWFLDIWVSEKIKLVKNLVNK